MSTETNKAIVRRLIEEVWNRKQIDHLDEYFTEGVIEHMPGMPPRSGLESVQVATAAGLNAFPDLNLTIEDAITAEDKVVVRWTMRGTHKGELLGIPPTGAQVQQAGVTVYRLENARIAELWFHPDNLGLMQQLGVIPAPQGA